MSLLEDAQKEYDGLLGEEIIHYSNTGATDEGDEFWYGDEENWDRENGTSFDGIFESATREEESQASGIDVDYEGTIRTNYDGAVNGDLFKLSSDSEWVVIEKTRLRYSGVNYGFLYDVKERQ